MTRFYHAIRAHRNICRSTAWDPVPLPLCCLVTPNQHCKPFYNITLVTIYIFYRINMTLHQECERHSSLSGTPVTLVLREMKPKTWQRDGLHKSHIDTYFLLSKARTRRNIKQIARDIYERIEQLNYTRCVSLHQQVTLFPSDNKALPNMTIRSDQRTICIFKLFFHPYIQIRYTGQAVCPLCGEHFDIHSVLHLRVYSITSVSL